MKIKYAVFTHAFHIISCFTFLLFGCTSASNSPNPVTYSFLVVGDWGRKGQFNQQEVANQMAQTSLAENAQFVISTGDNFYETGVNGLTDEHWSLSFENVYKGNLLQKDWFVVLGNHDYQGNVNAQIDYTQKSNRWKMPNRYFTVSKKYSSSASIRFIFIDTNPFISEYQSKQALYSDIAQQNTQTQLKWIDSVLASSHEKYKIVVGHHPIYSAGFGHGDQPELITTLKPLLEKYGVNLYLCGHSHSSQFIKNANSAINYIVAGAGSSTDELIKQDYPALFGTASPSFTLVKVLNDKIQVSFIDKTGNILFSKVID